MHVVFKDYYEGEDTDAHRYLPDGIYRDVTATIGNGLEVKANLIVRTVDGHHFSFAQAWR